MEKFKRLGIHLDCDDLEVIMIKYSCKHEVFKN